MASPGISIAVILAAGCFSVCRGPTQRRKAAFIFIGAISAAGVVSVYGGPP
ncbi:hypothetical protein PF010_g7726 [Phytophthora fragariae]|uniref:Uncharacterized protein n=1 Tax=Phytophthora fragariae TaxID=53985 RepID=A0A6G0P968_9STRA|nr:hypothetical protein PF010_g7726 [Phytophthora fragariae]KAE9240244.1 hypothetical protein PF004_g7588 [Phytophthora fragariae]